MGRFVASRGEAKGAAFAEVDEAKLRLFQVLGLQLKVVLTDRSEERVGSRVATVHCTRP